MRKGFTLMELIVVVIIVGILAMIGLPQFFTVAERGRAAEGFSILGTIRSAQLRYAAERSDNMTAGAMGDLDLTVPTLKYFAAPAPASVNVGTPANVVATIARSGGPTYSLGIQVGGNITCASGTCPKLPQ